MALADVDRWQAVGPAHLLVPVVAVERSETPIGDLLATAVGAEALRSNMPSRPGAEWDGWRATPVRVRRRLIGARFARHGALPPDVLADVIVGNVNVGDRDPIDWYVQTATRALLERRWAANRDRHLRVARLNGAPTYYVRRSQLVQQLGHRSLWEYRKAQGWS